jgi:hypothetical protein
MWLSFSISFTFSALLPYGFTPVDGFVVRRMLNHEGMNKFSQLNISVSFFLRATCWDLSRICCLGLPYSQSDVSTMSSGLA